MKNKILTLITCLLMLFVVSCSKNNDSTNSAKNTKTDKISSMSYTGDEYTLKSGDYELKLSQTGSYMKSFTYKGLNIIKSFSDKLPQYSQGQILFPYPNRLEDGKYTFDGMQYQLPINEVDRNNQLHGLSYAYNFTPSEQSESSITLSLKMPPVSGYPFFTLLSNTFSLSDNGLEVKSNVENIGKTSAPVGIGFHPWLDPRGSLDDATLQFNAKKWIETNDRLLPTDEKAVPEKFNFTKEKSLKGTTFDDAFINIKNNEVKFVASDKHVTTVWSDSKFPVWQFCSGDAIIGTDYRFGLAVEPMTCAANCFNTKKDLLVLKSGENWTGTWGIKFS